VIVHQLIALKVEPVPRHPDRFAAMTNRLRTGGTDHLLAAGRAVGIRRFIAPEHRIIGNLRPPTIPLQEGPAMHPDVLAELSDHRLEDYHRRAEHARLAAARRARGAAPADRFAVAALTCDPIATPASKRGSPTTLQGESS